MTHQNCFQKSSHQTCWQNSLGFSPHPNARRYLSHDHRWWRWRTSRKVPWRWRDLFCWVWNCKMSKSFNRGVVDHKICFWSYDLKLVGNIWARWSKIDKWARLTSERLSRVEQKEGPEFSPHSVSFLCKLLFYLLLFVLGGNHQLVVKPISGHIQDGLVRARY